MSWTRTATPKECAHCHKPFTAEEFRQGLLRYIEGLHVCTPCVEKILRAWAITFKDITEIS